MFNKYIALSALACAAILPLSAQAQNSADADVNITLVQPIAVSYNSGSGSMGTVIIPSSGSVSYKGSNPLGIDSAVTSIFSPGTPKAVVLDLPTAFDFTVTGGTGLGYSVTATFADTDSNDGVSVGSTGLMCQNSSGGAPATTRDSGAVWSGACYIQSGTTKVRVTPQVTVASSASATSNGKVSTLTLAVAYE